MHIVLNTHTHEHRIHEGMQGGRKCARVLLRTFL